MLLVQRLFKHTPEPLLLHCLTSTTPTFESNPSSLSARPCLTKDNLHRSAPAPCLLSSVITVVPQNHRLPFFFFVKYLQQCCVSMNMCVCAFLYIKARKSCFTSWFDEYCFFCHPAQEQTKVINALCEQISVLCKTKQYRVV